MTLTELRKRPEATTTPMMSSSYGYEVSTVTSAPGAHTVARTSMARSAVLRSFAALRTALVASPMGSAVCLLTAAFLAPTRVASLRAM